MNRAVGDLDPWRLGFHDLIHRASEVRPGHEMSSAIEERDLVFAFGEQQRRAKGHGAQEWDRHDLSLRHDAVEVFDPYRNQFDIRPRPRAVISFACGSQIWK